MPDPRPLKLLFVINPGSGMAKALDYSSVIPEHFSQSSHHAELYIMPLKCSPEKIRSEIERVSADRVIAVGGDGTVKLVAQSVMDRNIPLAIIPAGSANGMAKELGIPTDVKEALEVIEKGTLKKIHVIKINDELCIHLSDIGFNAYVVKKFESEKKRGMWTYIKAAWKVLWHYDRMKVDLVIDGKGIRRTAAMVVVANATRYGTGVVINPAGDLSDDLFEVVIIKKVSFREIFKMRFTHKEYDPAKTELFQTHSIRIRSGHRVHFQVDGEYLGKTKTVEARIIPRALEVMVPENNQDNKL